MKLINTINITINFNNYKYSTNLIAGIRGLKLIK